MVIDMTGVWTAAKDTQEAKNAANRAGFQGATAVPTASRARKTTKPATTEGAGTK